MMNNERMGEREVFERHIGVLCEAFFLGTTRVNDDNEPIHLKQFSRNNNNKAYHAAVCWLLKKNFSLAVCAAYEFMNESE